MKKSQLIFMFSVLVCFHVKAQINWDLGGRIKNAVERKVDQGIDRTIDKGVDEAEEGIRKGGKEATEKDQKDPKSNSGSNNSGSNSGSNTNSGGDNGTQNTPTQSTYKTYSKFDFVPGEKVVAVEDFSQDAIGDFPARWNTNAAGEIVTVEGKQGKYFQLTSDGVSYPEFITDLPENFTFEFDLICNPEYSYYSTSLMVNFTALTSDKDYTFWKQYAGSWDKKINGVRLGFSPTNAGSTAGHSFYECWENGEVALKNDNGNVSQFNAKTGKNVIHVSIWRQKQRMRVYVNEEKIWDIPKAFQVGVKYNKVLFTIGGYHNENDKLSVGNLRLAVGAPDTRNKLITEGKFVTNGILFDVNSDKIKPESYGAIKDIANVLNENPDVKVKIIGHTDSDGDEAKNLELSKKRSEAVKNFLIKEFAISADRMQTDGKGESQPTMDNATIEGKANNRRVEFLKM